MYCHSLKIPAKYHDNRLGILAWDRFALAMPFCPDFPYVFITNYYVNNECLFIHGFPEAILKVSATENVVDDC